MKHFPVLWLFSFVFLIWGCQSSIEQEKKETENLEKEIVKDEQELEKEEQKLEKEENQVDQPFANDTTPKSLSFLIPFRDRYPHDISFLELPLLKPRLLHLLGKEKYAYVKQIWQVETPIEIKDSLFYAWGMEAHSGGDPSAVVMADLNQNLLYVGIRQNGTEKMYAENNRPVPPRLMEWANEQ